MDNYFKAVTDAAEGILYKNDGQIAVMVCQKLYSMRPRTEIEIMSLEEGMTKNKLRETKRAIRQRILLTGDDESWMNNPEIVEEVRDYQND